MPERTDPPGRTTPLLPPRDSAAWVPPVDIAITCARQALTQYRNAGIHDHHAMAQAAAALGHVLEDLLAALDAEYARALPHGRTETS
ncbi:hypothetical protein ACWF94_24815 [Streptomyces sp. NPDC055078]